MKGPTRIPGNMGGSTIFDSESNDYAPPPIEPNDEFDNSGKINFADDTGGGMISVDDNDTTFHTAERELFEGMIENREQFKANVIYFGYDRSDVGESEHVKIERVKDYLESNLNAKLKIEGHCDERGTLDYNTVLGEQRALGLRAYLINAGIDSNRIYSISFGESLPSVEGTTEEAYAKNRRGEFVLLTNP